MRSAQAAYRRTTTVLEAALRSYLLRALFRNAANARAHAHAPTATAMHSDGGRSRPTCRGHGLLLVTLALVSWTGSRLTIETLRGAGQAKMVS